MLGRRPGSLPKNWNRIRRVRFNVENAFFRVGGILFAEKSRWKLGKNDGLLGSFQAWNDGCFSRKDRLETVRRQTHCVFFSVREGNFKGQSLWRWLDRYWRMSLPNALIPQVLDDINMWCSDAFILWISSSVASAACLCVGCETTCDTFSNGMSFGQLFFSCCKTWAQHFQRVGYVNSLEGIWIRSYLYIPNS